MSEPALNQCPKCAGTSLAIAIGEFNMRWVECRLCGKEGPHRTNEPAAVIDWNGLDRSGLLRQQIAALTARVAAAEAALTNMGAALTDAQNCEARLEAVAHHMRHCVQCGEMDVSECDEGKPLWDAAFPPADGEKHG